GRSTSPRRCASETSRWRSAVHVSGTLAMLDGADPDLERATAMGVSLFAGEAEGRLERVLQDADARTLAPLYNFMDDLPGIEGTPIPLLAARNRAPYRGRRPAAAVPINVRFARSSTCRGASHGTASRVFMSRCAAVTPARVPRLLGQHARGVVSFPLRASHGRRVMTVTTGRRELLTALGGAATWPLAERAQKASG